MNFFEELSVFLSIFDNIQLLLKILKIYKIHESIFVNQKRNFFFKNEQLDESYNSFIVIGKSMPLFFIKIVQS